MRCSVVYTRLLSLRYVLYNFFQSKIDGWMTSFQASIPLRIHCAFAKCEVRSDRMSGWLRLWQQWYQFVSTCNQQLYRVSGCRAGECSCKFRPTCLWSAWIFYPSSFDLSLVQVASGGGQEVWSYRYEQRWIMAVPVEWHRRGRRIHSNRGDPTHSIHWAQRVCGAYFYLKPRV